MGEQSKMELDRHFAWFEARLPPGPARFVGWLRKEEKFTDIDALIKQMHIDVQRARVLLSTVGEQAKSAGPSRLP